MDGNLWELPPWLLPRVRRRSPSAWRKLISARTCSMDSSKKISTSERFCSTSAARRFTLANSLVFSLTSCRRPAASSSASAAFFRSVAARAPLSRSNSRVAEDTYRSSERTLDESSPFSLFRRCPCLAHSLMCCSLSATSCLSRRLAASRLWWAACSSSVSRTWSFSSAASRRFSKRIFLVDASSRSTACSCELFCTSASCCLYSDCSLLFSSRNRRSIASTASSCASASSRRACSAAASAASCAAFFSLKLSTPRSST
mmetsp:Transcript_36739/g.107823  ORF Transcript_36739/g.107823 Transcript_36739/m.107823 type:complete len:259 (-) Transcript_36739:350-1126(-)